MRPVRTDSSYLQSLSYDERNHTLTVRFRDRSLIVYSGVPIQTYRAVVLADSIGERFTELVRDNYAFKILRKAA